MIHTIEYYVGKIVSLIIDNDLILAGRLSNHGENLYQVTGDNHYVFRVHEVSGLHLEKSTGRLTIYIL